MASKKLVCTQCGYVGEPKGAIGGNGCIEVLLWCFLIIPGLIYSIWRSSSRHKICPKCKSPTLIPIDSPRAKTIMAESMTKEEIVDLETKQADTEFKSKYLQWLNWCKKHIFWTIIIVIVGVPFVGGMISAIFSSDEPKPTPQVTSPVSQKPVPSLTLTERLKNINNDPYWAKTEPEDYSTSLKIQAQSMIFGTYISDIKEGEKSSSEEDKQLASEIKKKLIAKQVKEYPKMRKAYTQFAHNTLWKEDIDVSSSGSTYTTITLVGSIFASNKGIASIEGTIESMLKELRFKRVNYKWIAHEEEYQYFDLKTPSDSELVSTVL